jgi:hypothetical protein
MGLHKKYETVEMLEKEIEKYFQSNKGKITITGLALFLGFESRQSIYDYEKDGVFSYTIKKARLRVENHYENELLGVHTSGAIFALKNFGWADNQNVNIKTEQPIFQGIDLDVPKDNSAK